MLRLILPMLLLVTAACSAPEFDRPAGADPTIAVEPAAAPVTPTVASSDLLIVGDVAWSRYTEDWARGRSGWPFRRLGELGRYDGFVGNLECPVVDSDEDSATQDRLLRFHCSPAFLDAAARWFTAFSLANNHTGNHGPAGLASTRRELTAHGIQFFGDPEPERLARVCSPVLVAVRTDTADDAVLPVAMCGWDGVFSIPSPASIAEVSRWADHVPVLAFPHSGLEYVATPDSIKVALDHALVDAGADAVFGGHPHWVQPSEAWHGRLIVYSLGNFLFDQQHDPERTHSAAIHLRLTLTDDVAAWLELGRRCADDPAGCLATLESGGLGEMPARLEYAVVGTRNEHRLTHPATAEETRAIEERLDWEETMADLSPSYGPLQ